MAFSPLPRNYDEAIKEINVWRAKYTREAQSNAAPQEKRTQELPGRGENIDLLNAPAGAAPVAENAALRDDAERYRFIRGLNAFATVQYCGMFGPKELKGKKLDKAIDAARKK